MDLLLNQLAWNVAYARALVDGIPPEAWGRPGPKGLENHPAWTLGHIITGLDMVAEDVGLERDLPPGWQELFERRGPGDPRLPDPDASAYPSPTELVRELDRQHRRIATAIRGTASAKLGTPVEWRFDSTLPTLGDVTAFMLVTHVAMHLGQLAAWRRHHGLPSALAAMRR